RQTRTFATPLYLIPKIPFSLFLRSIKRYPVDPVILSSAFYQTSAISLDKPLKQVFKAIN
ncbi:MAG TPA: hypothetical protein PKI63_09720, partial [Candidatus Cloacimonadota bacterium]|nr:hypothetical protein [Candidatus Cloacimonadota bacterium]